MTANPEVEGSSDSSLTLVLLGATALARKSPIGEARVVLASGKPLALLTFLHCAPAQTASREQLLELLWSDAEPEAGRHTLRQTLWYIKRKIGVDPLTTSGDGVRLSVPITSDRDAFLSALDEDDPERALQCYAGEFFPEFAAPGGASFEHWADVERARLRGLFIGAASRVVQDRLRKGRAREALVVARRAIELAPRQQGAWRLVLESYLAANDAVGATVEAERLQQWLDADDIEPEASTTQLLRSVRAGTTRSAVSSAGPTSAPSLHAELVGRESEFAELVAAFETVRKGQSRHVHVSAPAGFGKSRLLDGLAARLRANRARVIVARGTPAERSLPYAFAAHLVSALVQLRGAAAVSPDAASTLIALAPSASNYLRAEVDRSTGDDALRRRSMAVTELVATLAHDAPVSLLIDDVHWIDAQSRVLLATLATRSMDSALLLVTSARTSDRFIEEAPNASRIALKPLSPDDVAALLISIGELPAEPWADAFVAALHATSAGSPLMVLETLQLVMEREQLVLVDKTWRVPNADALIATLGAGMALQQRIAALSGAARDTLLRLAVTGSAVNVEELPVLLAADGRDALTQLEVRGLVARVDNFWRVAHDEIAECAMSMAADADRVRANQAAAEYLERTGRDELTRLLRAAFHRSRAGDLPALDRVFLRAVRVAGAEGDVRAMTQLGREALGANATQIDVSAMVDRVPWRVRARPQRWFGGIVAVASIAVIAAAIVSRGNDGASAREIGATLFIANESPNEMLRLDIDARELARGEPIALSRARRSLFPTSVLNRFGIYGLMSSGEYLADGLLSKDASQGMDLFTVAADGSYKTFVGDQHDQSNPVLSPDGAWVAYPSGQWHPSQRSEIALRRVGVSTSIRLTETDERESGLAWSDDGSRLAFVRMPYARNQGDAAVCWTTLDKRAGRCFRLIDQLIPSMVVAWRGDQSLLLAASRDVDSRLHLLQLDLRDGSQQVIDTGGVAYRADPKGRIVLCQCVTNGYPDDAIVAFDPADPAHKSPLTYQNVRVRSLNMVLWDPPRTYVDSIRIERPAHVYAGKTQQLRASGHRADGGPRGTPSLQWSSLDPNVGTIDSLGNLTPQLSGRVRVVASAGGWRADTVSIQVEPSGSALALTEDWSRPIDSGWISFGTPSPTLEGSGSTRTLRTNGDRHLTSGVISKASLEAGAGAGVSVRVRAPIDTAQWQAIAVALLAMPDRMLDSWIDKKTGYMPGEWFGFIRPRTCNMRAPREEGSAYLDALALSAGARGAAFRTTKLKVTDGKWHEITLQIMTDGICALAIDGEPVARSEIAVRLDAPLRIMIEGQSVGTIIDVGHVEAWTGVRSGIPWEILDTRPTASKQLRASTTRAQIEKAIPAAPSLPPKQR